MGIVLAGLAFLACKRGERAAAGGHCPPGETCSDRTPLGLMFAGAHSFTLADLSEILPTAIGGRQTIAVHYADEPQEPYVAGFEARVINSGVIALESADGSSVILRGMAQGNALLRLLEPRTNKLLDRVEITTAPIAQVALLPREFGYGGQKEHDAKWAVLAGSPAELGVLLLDQNNNQIVDEALTVSAHAATITRNAWDVYEVTAVYPDSVSFAVRAGGRQFTAEAQVVTSIDNIVLKSPDVPEEKPITLKRGAKSEGLCFLAKLGGVTVTGGRWSFQPSETVSIETYEESDWRPWYRKLWTPPSCVLLSGQEAGPATLKVTAGNHQKIFKLVIE
jgi:hypothetical protein